eukprot:1173491-Heterocapsa_arctica.AAC.1
MSSSQMLGKGSMMAKNKSLYITSPWNIYGSKSFLTRKAKASLNKGKRVADTNTVVKRAQALALAVREKVNIIKTGGPSKATYVTATDPFYTGRDQIT